MSQVTLVGLDFGTTTCGAVIASARLAPNSVSGRVDVTDVRETFRSPLEFTPLVEADDGPRLDLARMERLLDGWLQAAAVDPETIFGGGALLTGLTAKKQNAADLVALVRSRLADALVAVADDPCLESWLAFMGSAAPLSRRYPDRTFLNLDIGGGTTNLAIGRAGQVLATGCLFVGARHVQTEPGSRRIVRMSRYALAAFESLGIAKRAGEELSEAEVDALVKYQERLLVAAIRQDRCLCDPLAQMHVERPLQAALAEEPILTLSGGVGELVYAALDGKPWPEPGKFGDLGIELARRLAGRADWRESLLAFRPASAGRATVYGLLRHNTQVTGSTLYVSHPEILPLAEMPILGAIDADPRPAELDRLLTRVARSPRGGCLLASCPEGQAQAVRRLGEAVRGSLSRVNFPSSLPLVLLVRENVGKALGQYVSEWGLRPVRLLVLDQVHPPDSQFARIGALRDQVIPVSFHGLREPGAG